METVVLLTLEKVATLLLFISIGFILRKSNKLPEDTAKVLSTLAATLFTPAYTISNLSKTITMQTLREHTLLFCYGILMVLLVIGFAYVLARPMTKNLFERRCLTYAFAIPNYGYFGYPVVEGVFGAATLGNFMIFAAPISVATYSWGYLLFSKEKKLSLKKLLSPMLLSVIIGVALGLSGLKLPGVVQSVLSGAASCMSPASMLLAGFVLGGLPLKKLLSGRKAYGIALVRLLVIPVIFGIPMYLLGLRGDLLMIPLLVLSLPLGLNMVVFPESYGYDSTDNARMCFVSYLLSIVILPCTFAIINFLAF